MTLDQQGRADVGRMLGDHVHGLRPLFAHDRDAAILHDPRLLNSDLGDGRSEVLGVVEQLRDRTDPIEARLRDGLRLPCLQIADRFVEVQPRPSSCAATWSSSSFSEASFRRSFSTTSAGAFDTKASFWSLPSLWAMDRSRSAIRFESRSSSTSRSNSPSLGIRTVPASPAERPEKPSRSSRSSTNSSAEIPAIRSIWGRSALNTSRLAGEDNTRTGSGIESLSLWAFRNFRTAVTTLIANPNSTSARGSR